MTSRIWVGCGALLCCVVAYGDSGRPAGTRAPVTEDAKEVVYRGGVAPHWNDYGWATRKLVAGKPAEVDFSREQGWILANPQLAGDFEALRFRLKSAPADGDFLLVHMDSGRRDFFPRVNVGPQHRVDLPDGWSEVRIPLSELNPDHLRWDRFVIVGQRGKGAQALLDEIVFTPASKSAAAAKAPVPTTPAHLVVNCTAAAQPISDLIYGIAVQAEQESKNARFWQLGAGARRFGGNATSTYNWKLGNAWNVGNDWFFRNVQIAPDPRVTYRNVLDDDVEAGVKTALTLPMLGWVAKDTSSASFPVSVYGAQADQHDDAGDGLTKSGANLEPGPPTRTCVAAPPSFVGDWVRQIRKDDDAKHVRSVAMYILDNEPALWNSTHRDLHPEPVSYDELLQRTLDYGTEVRKADPEAVIAGPAEWGWPAYFYSAVDAKAKFHLRTDRLRHGNKPLLAWYLEKLHSHQAETGVHILDVLDVHFYPMADRVGGKDGGTDRKTAELRLRSTRALWDPTYVDESWIREPVQLIPRLKQWIAEEDPGLGISIGEWNFGAEDHISGGLAVAEALGRFGQQGVRSAFYWTYPPDQSPAFWAFRAYRNFDGKGGHFLSRSVPTLGADGVSLFASRDAGSGHVVLVALNLKPDTAFAADVDVSSCGSVTSQRAFVYAGGSGGLTQGQTHASGGAVSATLDPYSITVFDLQLSGR